MFSEKAASDLPFVQNLIINASKVFNIPTTSAGICNGYATMAIFASLTDDLKSFDSLVQLLCQHSSSLENLKTMVNTAKKSPTTDEKTEQLLTLESFLWSINIAQNPEYYCALKEFMGLECTASAASWKNQNFTTAYALLHPKELENLPIYTNASTYSFKHNMLNEWCNALFASSAATPSDRMQCLLLASKHSIALVYDTSPESPETKVWRIIDANGSFSAANPQALADGIIKHSFQYSGTGVFSCQWIAGDKALWYQPIFENPNFLKESLAHPELVDTENESALFLACAGIEDTFFVQSYFSNAQHNPIALSYVNARGNNGVTPLYAASVFGYLDTVELLLAHGAFVNVKTTWSLATPLYAAVYFGHPPVVKSLLAAGADTEAADNYRTTPLSIASYYGDLESVTLLLEHKANVKAADRDGYTALHIACEHGYLSIAEQLINYGAPTDVLNKFGNTPLELARIFGHEEIVDTLLQSHGLLVSQDQLLDFDSFILAEAEPEQYLEQLFEAPTQLDPEMVILHYPVYMPIEECYSIL